MLLLLYILEKHKEKTQHHSRASRVRRKTKKFMKWIRKFPSKRRSRATLDKLATDDPLYCPPDDIDDHSFDQGACGHSATAYSGVSVDFPHSPPYFKNRCFSPKQFSSRGSSPRRKFSLNSPPDFHDRLYNVMHCASSDHEGTVSHRQLTNSLSELSIHLPRTLSLTLPDPNISPGTPNTSRPGTPLHLSLGRKQVDPFGEKIITPFATGHRWRSPKLKEISKSDDNNIPTTPTDSSDGGIGRWRMNQGSVSHIHRKTRAKRLSLLSSSIDATEDNIWKYMDLTTASGRQEN